MFNISNYSFDTSFHRTSSFFRLYLITWMMHLILIGGSRISWRIARSFVVGKQKRKPTLIVGAGRGFIINKTNVKKSGNGFRTCIGSR